MNALARYLLVFLLGWSGAVWSYSDLIYKVDNTSEKTRIPQKTNDISLPDALKPSPIIVNGLNDQNIEQSSPDTAPKKNEEQTMTQ
jgi:hypothetical protein